MTTLWSMLGSAEVPAVLITFMFLLSYEEKVSHGH